MSEPTASADGGKPRARSPIELFSQLRQVLANFHVIGSILRILHVIGSLIHGGAEALLYRLATRPSSHEHVIVSIGPPGHYSPLLAEAGIEVHHLHVDSVFGGIASTFRLRSLMRKLHPDVVQTWMYRANVVAGLCAKSLGVPVVWGVHCSSFAAMGPITRSWIRLSGLMAGWLPSRIINCSARSAGIHRQIGYREELVDVVPNGYDTKQFRPDEKSGQRMRRELGVGGDTFLIANVSRWHPMKDHATLLSALRLLKSRRPSDWHCLLIGRDVTLENSDLAALIREAGLEGEVTCLGPRSDIAEIMRAIDLHVLSSAFGEAFPNVVAEAMSTGTPCLVTDVGDSAFLVGSTGWIAPPSDPAAIARQIEAAMDEWKSRPEEWHRRQEAGRQRVISHFTIELMAQRYERIWTSVARGASPPKGRHEPAPDGADRIGSEHPECAN